MRSVEQLGRVGVVGASGGFRGASIVGFLEGLTECGVVIEYAYGVSVSALVLAGFAEAHSPDEYPKAIKRIIHRFKEIEERGSEEVFNFNPLNLAGHLLGDSLMGNSSLYELLFGLDIQSCLTSPMRFDFGVQSEQRGENIIFSNRSSIFELNPELFRRAVVASASLTPFFAPVEIGGDSCTDGISISLDGATKYCDTVFVLFPYPRKHQMDNDGFPPWFRHFVINYEIQIRKTDARILECALSHAQIRGRPKIYRVFADNSPLSLGTLSFKKKSRNYEGDLTVARLGAKSLIERKLRSILR